MRVLSIETSQRVGSLAALKATSRETSIVCDEQLPAEQRSARSLVPSIQLLLRDCGWTPSQLDLICVTTGPGSFTGLRIGVTTAKTLAYATGAKLVEVHTLAAIAAAASTPYVRLWAILDAQREELFASQFPQGWHEGQVETPKTRIVSVQQWLDELSEGDVVSGPPLQKLSSRLPAHVQVADPNEWAPRAEVVGRLGIAAYQCGKAMDAMQLVPRYYRKSAAEEKADGR